MNGLQFQQPTIARSTSSCGTITVEASSDDSSGDDSTDDSGSGGSGGDVVSGLPNEVALLAVVLVLAIGAVVVL